MGSNPFAGMDWMQRIADSHGKHVVSAGEAGDNKAAIDTHVTGATCFLVQVIRAGKVATSDAAVSLSAGVLTVGDGSTFNLTADDVIMYWVW